jgi:hypothetical protein
MLASLEAEGETFLSQTVTADDIRDHHFAWETINGMESIHKLPEEQIQKAFIRGQGYDYCLLGLRRGDSCGYNAKREDKPIPHQCADRTQEAFKKNWASQESNTNVVSA